MNMMFDLIFPVMFLLIFGMILFAFISGRFSRVLSSSMVAVSRRCISVIFCLYDC